MNRRYFTQLLAISVTLVTTPACLFSTIWSDIKAYAPTILTAVAGVLSILTGAGVLGMPLAATISGILALINKAVGDLQVAINTYQQAPSSQRATLLGAITTALADAEANIQQFWSNLNIPDPALASTIKNLLGIVVSTLQGYVDAIGVPPAATPARAMRASMTNPIVVAPKRRTLAQFKTDWNAALTTAYKHHAL